MIESLQITRFVEHNITGNEKSIVRRYATLSFLPLHSSGILSTLIFCLPKINKSRNDKVCSTIPLGKKQPTHLQCKLIHWFYTAKDPAKGILG